METRKTLPKRFADYFVVVGAGKVLEPLDKKFYPTSSSSSSSSSSVSPLMVGPEIETSCFGVSFKAEVMDRVPRTDYESPLPPHVAMFCFPRGVIVSRVRRPPTFFVFTLTEVDGTRFFGAVLRIYEETVVHPPLPPHMADSVTKEPVFIPLCLCVISHFPLLSTFREFLRGMYRLVKAPGGSPLPVERYISNMLFDVPLPIPGTSAVICRIGSGDTAVTKRVTLPAGTHFPLADFSIKYLFDCLGVDGAVTLFFALLEERKILFVSRQCTLLTLAAEALTALMHPFAWHHVYIPILGITLRDFLQAPTPFIMGIVREPGDPVPELPEVVVVELDTGRLHNPFKIAFPVEREQLIRRLGNILTPHLLNLDLAFPPDDPINAGESGVFVPEKSDLIVAHSQASVDTRIRVAFLLFFVSMFSSYRKYLRFVRKYPSPVTYFDKALFLCRQQDENKPFIGPFLDTQAFNIFLENSALQHPNLFDLAIYQYAVKGDKSLELILHRKNRHKREHVYEVPQPSLVGIPPGACFKYKSFPALSADLLLTRDHPQVITDVKEAPLDVPCYDEREELTDQEECESDETASPLEAQFITRTISDIMTSKPISMKQQELLLGVLDLRQGRVIFANKIVGYVNSHPDTCLSDITFSLLAEIVEYLLSDTRTPTVSWQLLKVVSAIYHDVGGLPEFLHAKLTGLELYKNMQLWEFCFYRDVQERRKVLPEHFRSSIDDWASMDAATQKKASAADEKIIFDAVGRLVVSMVMMGAAEAPTRHFISRSASLSGINEQQLGTLFTFAQSIGKSNRASAAQIEDLKVKTPASAVPAPSLFGPARRTQQRHFHIKELHANLQQFCSPTDSVPPSPRGAAAVVDEGDPKARTPRVMSVRREDYAVSSLEGRSGAVECLLPYESILLSGTSTGRITLWDYEGKVHLGAISSHTDKINALQVCDGAIISASSDRTVKLTDLSTRVEFRTLTGHSGPVLAIDTNAHMIVSCSQDGGLRVWDKRDGRQVSELTGHRKPVRCLQIGPRGASDGSPIVVSGSEDNTVKLWDLRMFSCVLTMSGHTDWVKKVVFDTRRIISASYDCTLRLWDLTTGDCTKTLAGHADTVNSFAYLPSRDEIVSASGDNSVIRWSIEKGAPISTFQGHSASVAAVVEMPDGTFATSSFDRTVRTWTARGRCTKILRGHSDWVCALVCLPNGDLASGSWDSTVRIWHMGPAQEPSSSSKPAPIVRTGSQPDLALFKSVRMQAVAAPSSPVPQSRSTRIVPTSPPVSSAAVTPLHLPATGQAEPKKAPTETKRPATVSFS